MSHQRRRHVESPTVLYPNHEVYYEVESAGQSIPHLFRQPDKQGLYTSAMSGTAACRHNLAVAYYSGHILGVLHHIEPVFACKSYTQLEILALNGLCEADLHWLSLSEGGRDHLTTTHGVAELFVASRTVNIGGKCR
jgi:hypothetical protein